MTDFMQYEKGCSPCAIQRKYGLTYVQGYELAERLKKTQELAEENTKLKELLKECREFFYEYLIDTEFHFSCGLGSNIKKQSCIRSLSNLKTKINQVLGEE